jgi:hypothetical protein
MVPVIGWLTSTVTGLDSSGQNAASPRRGPSPGVTAGLGRGCGSPQDSDDLRDPGHRGGGGKCVTKSIPIGFHLRCRPVGLGLAASLNRPGRNITGISLLMKETAAKRLSLLHELVPAAALIGYLSDPSTPAIAELKPKNCRLPRVPLALAG